MFFGIFLLREKRKRWLNFLPVGADSKSGATWVSQSVSTSVARAGPGRGRPFQLCLCSAFRSLSRSLARSNKRRILFGFSVAVGASLQDSRRETETSCCCCCCSSRKEGRKEGGKKDYNLSHYYSCSCRPTRQFFKSKKNNNFPVFSCNVGELKQQQQQLLL